MPGFFNKVFKRDYGKRYADVDGAASSQPATVEYQDPWLRSEVSPSEVQELLRECTHEIKARGLSTPFLLLPFRPNTDPNVSRTFIRSFFNPSAGPMRGAHLQQELRLTEPTVLCSTLKWCWSRLPGGVVTWDVYELFRQGEVDSSMARDAFATFIPISAESEARSKIIFDFFDLLSAIAAHGKHNGLGGLKLSRLAGWWAFEHIDAGYGFEGGYVSWGRAADATCHLFFAYLRSLSPADGSMGVSMLPTSLKALLASIDYPPAVPSQLQSKTARVVILVESVSPTLFALLRRVKGFQYYFPENERALKAFSEYPDPMSALTDECKRVLKCIASTNQSSAKSAAGQDQAWSRFQDMGFSSLLDESDNSDGEDMPTPTSDVFRRRRASVPADRIDGNSQMDIARPTTPSWADFMSSGFGDKDQLRASPAPLLLPPDKILPPIGIADRSRSAQSSRRIAEENLDPGELGGISPMEIDDAFWWVWMSSLASEEPAARKAVFGRCAIVETVVKGGRWLVIEEKVKGAADNETEVAYLSKKDKKKSKRAKLTRRKSVSRTELTQPSEERYDPSLPSLSRTKIGPDQTAKIQVAAAALRQQQLDQEHSQLRRRPLSHGRPATRTNSVFTLQPVIMSEASPAMKWANKYDRDALRDAYLKGATHPDSVINQTNIERDLPALPQEERQGSEPAVSVPDALGAGAERGHDTPRSPTSTQAAPAAPPMLNPPSPSTGCSSPVVEKRASLALSPQTSPKVSLGKNPKGKVSRFKMLFGKRAETAKPAPIQPTFEPIKASSNGAAAQSATRRKKHAPIEIPKEPKVTALSSLDTADTEPMSSPAEHVHPAEAIEQSPRRSDYPVDSEVEVEAHQAFSSFDQGPLEDQPAFVPDDNTPTPEAEPPIAAKAPRQSDDVSEPSPPTSPMPAQDRWARIRQNAAERARATAPKVSEESSARDRRESMDDGDTSGEETIESRVARIKARVAELTGNVEPASGERS